MRLMWVLIVWLLRNRRSAISPLVRPWAIRLRISTSRWVRPSGGSGGRGNGLLVELAGLAAGLLCGLVVTTLMRVYRSPKTGRPVSAAGLPYAIVWALIVAARAAFSIGATHWFPTQLAQWCATHQVTGAAITDGLIFMAITMVLVRTVGLAARATRLPSAAAGHRQTAAV
jgi:hypothetical protein